MMMLIMIMVVVIMVATIMIILYSIHLQVWPISGFHDNDINVGSGRLVDQHSKGVPQ